MSAEPYDDMDDEPHYKDDDMDSESDDMGMGMDMDDDDDDDDDDKEFLFTLAMRGQWNEIVKAYEYNGEALWTAKITKSGDTALHVAVSYGKLGTVEKLLGATPDTQKVPSLQVKNEKGNTPLHLAASMGSVKICDYFAKQDPGLVIARNKAGETPLFLAALHGNTDAFLRLRDHCHNKRDDRPYIRDDGDTILHCAISRNYFDLAFLIIRQYNDFSNSLNDSDLTPLHILAHKPSAFRSGCHLGWLDAIVYHCLFVDKPEEESPKETGSTPHEKYQTGVNFFQNLMLILSSIRNFADKLKKDAHLQKPGNENVGGNKPAADIESHGSRGGDGTNRAHVSKGGPSYTKPGSSTSEQVEDRQKTCASWAKSQLDSFKHTRCYIYFKRAMSPLLVVLGAVIFGVAILGVGFTRTRKILKMKKEHTMAVEIMEEMVEKASAWKYTDAGGDPNKQDGAIPPKGTQAAQEGNTKSKEAKSGPGASSTAQEGNTNGKEATSGPGASSNEFSDCCNALLSVLKTQAAKEGDTKSKEAKSGSSRKGETPILIAARMGVTEMVEEILDKFPVAVQDLNSEEQNIVMLATENRQLRVFQLLQKRDIIRENMFSQVDINRNSPLHLAATLSELHRPWFIPGAALQMQWEIKWYKFVKNSMPTHSFDRYNKEGKTPKQVFSTTHKDLIEEGGKWLTNTSQSYSVIAALIATVAFATATSVPGGVQQSGLPTFENKPAFDVFAFSSLVALCFSVTALITFLSILTSRYEERDFESDLPKKLILGLTSLFISITSVLVSFCAGHFFVLKDKLKVATYLVYAVMCLPITFFAIIQFPLYFDLIRYTFKSAPQRGYKVNPD
ncbi:hypothetical protein HHK36_012694 [Tetracentron sinense]|uniref:PGG domain-containing protein n=1 Tax=Tetracentron sinense TaxID=13715 RepID=A0A835DET6_TETSI|nr:hypothetical protein HHK36_012694 [Tetracentron sinense]